MKDAISKVHFNSYVHKVAIDGSKVIVSYK